MKKQDTYGEPTVFEYPNAIVRVYRPILSDEEQARRMRQVYKAAEELLKDVQKGGSGVEKEESASQLHR